MKGRHNGKIIPSWLFGRLVVYQEDVGVRHGGRHALVSIIALVSPMLQYLHLFKMRVQMAFFLWPPLHRTSTLSHAGGRRPLVLFLARGWKAMSKRLRRSKCNKVKKRKKKERKKPGLDGRLPRLHALHFASLALALDACKREGCEMQFVSFVCPIPCLSLSRTLQE